MSQRQLALQMGKDPRTINHVFTGPVHPDLGTLKDLCARLNVSADCWACLTYRKNTQPKTWHHFSLRQFQRYYRHVERQRLFVPTPDWQG